MVLPEKGDCNSPLSGIADRIVNQDTDDLPDSFSITSTWWTGLFGENGGEGKFFFLCDCFKSLEYIE